MKLEKMNLADLKPAPYNPRVDLKPGDAVYDLLKKGIKEYGLVEPVIWNKRTGYVVGGHQRLKVLADLGHKTTDVVVVDLDEMKEKALNIALNKLSGAWDEVKLVEIMTELDALDIDMELTGFNVAELEAMIKKEMPGNDDEFDIDAALENAAEPISRLGDIYKLGNHRLMCGDSTEEETFLSLMSGARAEITFTSPPYNAGALNISGNETTKAKYQLYDDNLSDEKYFLFLVKNITVLFEHSDEIFYNVGMVQNNKTTILELIHHFRNSFKDLIYWKKSSAAPHIQPGVINNLVEFIVCLGNEKRKFKNAQFNQGTYWNVIEGPNASGNEYSDIHKATFPVYLPTNIIENFSNPGANIIDCFGGTGSTLIACEQTGRNCYMMELDPKYCDVIIQRWETLTGRKAEKLN